MKTVVGMFASREDAQDAVRRLQTAGFHNESIGVAMHDRHGSIDLAHEAGVHDLAGEGAAAGAVSGAGVGALVGLALVGSTVVLPGVGTFLIGGPLAAALAGAGIGAVSGGLLGALIGAGIPEEEAREYAGRLEQGEILVSVQVPDEDVERARAMLEAEGARTE